ncbi:MAG: hypothetical protein NC408_01010 [Candidatus Gastranaerophilales bacterium]|nr:hypothetical protein [Candidatus Gastranaerophilales bacterium]MCM1072728.1 hypothetical protein [Bacteroides sp.]
MNQISLIRKFPIASIKGLKTAPAVSLNGLCSDVFVKSIPKEISMEKVVENFQNKLDEMLDNNFEGFEIFAPFNEDERIDFIDYLEEGFSDTETFCMFATGQKPSVLLSGDLEYIELAKKINDVDKVTVKVVLGKDEDAFLVNQIFLFNKTMVQELINDNLELFKVRLGLTEESSVSKIYEHLISDNGPIASDGATMKSSYNDIIGLLLGYPKTSCMIYELERRMPNPKLRYSYDLTEYKSELLKLLKGENSPYKNMNREFIKSLADKISSIKDIKRAPALLGGFEGYPFMYYVEEPDEILKIQSRIQETVQRI